MDTANPAPWSLTAFWARQNPRLRLAITGFIQVIFVAGNTVFISQYMLVGNFITALAISFVWTHNVKKIAFGDNADRWYYAFGAAFGSIAGTVLANAIMRVLA